MRENPSKPSEVINSLLKDVTWRMETRSFMLARAVRVIAEVYDNDEVIARTTLHPSISGYGATVDGAVKALTDDLIDTYLFYADKEDEDLTADAIELKRLLSEYIRPL
jgi:hypothetical protein